MCDIHAELYTKDGKCLACLSSSPPDLGISINEEIQTAEHID